MPNHAVRPVVDPATSPPPAQASGAPSAPPAPLRAAIWIFATLFALSLAGMVYIVTSGRTNPAAANPPGATGTEADSLGDPLATSPSFEGATIPALALIDQDGAAFTRADLEGRISVVAFFFSHCPLACPRMTAEMAKAAEKLKGTPVRLVSFTLDPAHDRPEDLRAWTARYKADTKQWRFVTEPDPVTSAPADGVIARMLRATWKLEVATVKGQTLETRTGQSTFNLVHPTELYLIGPTGKVLGRYPTSPNAPAGQIDALVRHALAAQAALTPGAKQPAGR